MEQLSENSDRRADTVAVADFLAAAGAGSVVALDLRGRCDFTDFFVICTANSEGQLRGLVRQVHEQLDELGLFPKQSVKRDDHSGWILLDCDDVVVHIMAKEQREFYELEKLWFDAEVIYS